MRNFTSVAYLRAISMLYIVGYWHLFDYTSVSMGRDNVIMQQVTHVVLAVFVFMSGFLLGGRKSKAMSALNFYRRRLIRIYPLYAIAIIIFYLYGMNSGWVTVKALLGISMYISPAPLTLWFVTMLLLFYLVTPVLLAFVDKVFHYISVIFIAVTVTLLIKFLFGSVDGRILMYFPCFCLGVFCASYGIDNRFVNAKTGIFGVVMGVALLFVETGYGTLDEMKEIPLLAFGPYMIFYLARQNEASFKELSIIRFLGYSGFAMYLFHRPIFTSMTSIYFPAGDIGQVVYLLTICLPTVALIACSFQKLYDLSCEMLRTRLNLTDATIKT